LSKVRVQQQEEVDRMEEERRQQAEELARRQQYQHQNAASQIADESDAEQPAESGTFEREERKVGRNEPCPCGSGKKYKQCHGKIN